MKYIRWMFAWIFYGLGDVASNLLILFQNSDRSVSFWYPIYNKLMYWSSSIQGEASSFGPWSRGRSTQKEKE